MKVCKDCLSTMFCIQSYAILFVLWRYNNLALKGLTLLERIARRPAACIAAINYETDYVETNTVDTAHGLCRGTAKVAEGEKGFAIYTLRGGEVKARKVERDVYYWFMNCGVLPLLCNAFLGNLFSDMIRIVKYRYLFAGRELQFITLKSSNVSSFLNVTPRRKKLGPILSRMDRAGSPGRCGQASSSLVGPSLGRESHKGPVYI
ncbi:Uncharacterized protein DBV15_09064 [Temnothorax longispinosus]|uniref:Uncharacterized protein n=1 Tax=Temnothorax longispinosus TaxID=300112 RepID=A0A4S2JPH8_9HYME|nr:Uncharacterized protein DBV15_09064 [Temnothorax longispinosus]